MPKLSIITPCFNSEKTLQDTIDSVLEQTYVDFEYLIIDGASTDYSLEIIKRNAALDDRIKYISEPDDGVYYAMNKGIKMATGEIVGILNSDDIYSMSTVFERIITRMRLKKADSIYADLLYVDYDLKKVTRYWKSGIYFKSAFLFGWMPPHPTFFVKRKIYEKYGVFNTSLRSASDYSLMLRFLYKHNVTTCYLPKVLVKMRLGGMSNSSILNRMKANSEDRLAWEINGLKPYFFTLTLKPIRKLIQFIKANIKDYSKV